MKNLKERFVETSYLQPSVHSRGSQKSPEVTKVTWNVAPLPVTNILTSGLVGHKREAHGTMKIPTS
jgi:hypothetical protein